MTAPAQQFTSKLVGQDESVQLLNQVLADPPHLFFSGSYGSGKTTLMYEFLKAYYAPHGISITDSQWVLYLSSEQDRGIHCVRQSVTEFVRHSSAKPGIYRWIIVDDADSLPMISQQALRRPMETHSHTTRFLFVSRYSTDLIQPLKSRCLHLELDTISPLILASHYAKEAGYPDLKLDHSSIAILMSLAQTPTEIKQIIHILCKSYGNREDPITSKEIMTLFASPSFSLCLDLLRAYIKQDKDEMKQLFLEIWTTGISYEDFLYELTSAIYQLGVLSPKTSQDIHQLILKGWISFAQGKTHSLDAMRLFFTETAGQA
jgi:DNA polymerase III delta prime subunit